MKSIKELKGKSIVIECRDEVDFEEIQKLVPSRVIITVARYRGEFRKNGTVCLRLCKDGSWIFSSKIYYIREKHEIIPATEILEYNKILDYEIY